MPKISVIMAAFNEEANIQNAILSIQEQTFKEWELVIVDDGSDDGTLNLINDAVSLDSRITCLSNDKNIGLAMSLNKAISFSNSEYIARMDADDYSLPDRLETQLNFMQGNPDISVLGTGGIYCDQNGTEIKKVIFPEHHNEIVKWLNKSSPFLHPSVLIRRSFFQKIGGYDDSYYRAQDYDLWHRGKNIARYCNLQIPLINYTDKEKLSIQSVADSFRIRIKHAGSTKELLILLFWLLVGVVKRIMRFLN